jgi:hypothetical protein
LDSEIAVAISEKQRAIQDDLNADGDASTGERRSSIGRQKQDAEKAFRASEAELLAKRRDIDARRYAVDGEVATIAFRTKFGYVPPQQRQAHERMVSEFQVEQSRLERDERLFHAETETAYKGRLAGLDRESQVLDEEQATAHEQNAATARQHEGFVARRLTADELGSGVPTMLYWIVGALALAPLLFHLKSSNTAHDYLRQQGPALRDARSRPGSPPAPPDDVQVVSRFIDAERIYATHRRRAATEQRLSSTSRRHLPSPSPVPEREAP